MQCFKSRGSDNQCVRARVCVCGGRKGCKPEELGVIISVCVCVCSAMPDSVTPWTVVHQTPLSMEFSRQEYWSGVPFPTPGDRPKPGIEPESFVSPALAGRFFFTTSAAWEAPYYGGWVQKVSEETEIGSSPFITFWTHRWQNIISTIFYSIQASHILDSKEGSIYPLLNGNGRKYLGTMFLRG